MCRHAIDSKIGETFKKIGSVVNLLYNLYCIDIDFLNLLWLNAISMGI